MVVPAVPVKIYSESGEGTTVQMYITRYKGEYREALTIHGTMESGRGSEKVLNPGHSIHPSGDSGYHHG